MLICICLLIRKCKLILKLLRLLITSLLIMLDGKWLWLWVKGNSNRCLLLILFVLLREEPMWIILRIKFLINCWKVLRKRRKIKLKLNLSMLSNICGCLWIQWLKIPVLIHRLKKPWPLSLVPSDLPVKYLINLSKIFWKLELLNMFYYK